MTTMQRRRFPSILFLAAGALLWPTGAVAAEPVSRRLVIEAGRLVSGPEVIRLKRDDAVELTIVSDSVDECHLHGYDLRAALRPGTPVTLRFVARRTGRFALELHRSGREFSVLEVYPK